MKHTYFVLPIVMFSVLVSEAFAEKPAGPGPAELPPARKIPGLNAQDKFPLGCVDCHVNMPHINQDERLSTLMSKWNEGVEKELLDKAQAVAPPGVTLKGIHPAAGDALTNIPENCKSCHGKASQTAPPLAPLIHMIHLVGGDENHFLAIFQGECTHCHKLGLNTGLWSMPSGQER